MSDSRFGSVLMAVLCPITFAAVMLFPTYGSLTVDRRTFTGNFADGLGGAIDAETGATIMRSTFSGNLTGTSSGCRGGALHLAGPADIMGCTFGGNSSFVGGAIHAGQTTSITHCTIAGNGVFGTGGGIYVSLTGIDPLTLANSIVFGNTAGGSAQDIRIESSTLTRRGANLVGLLSNFGTINGIGTISNADPLLAPLDNYGGPTKTMALKPGSPARNASVGSTLTSDQRGFPIVGMPDIGAYEAGNHLSTIFNAWIWETLPATATNAQHAGTFDFDRDGVSNLNEWLALTNATDPASYLRIASMTRVGTDLRLSIPTVVGRNYALDYSTDLSVWRQFLGATFVGDGTNWVTAVDMTGLPRLFIRLRVGP